jgi:hypothetical protein
MKSRRTLWLQTASDSDLLMIYNLYKNWEDILYMSFENTDKYDNYDKLGASVEKEITHRQMLKECKNK